MGSVGGSEPGGGSTDDIVQTYLGGAAGAKPTNQVYESESKGNPYWDATIALRRESL
jgi:hypothetical protein